MDSGIKWFIISAIIIILSWIILAHHWTNQISLYPGWTMLGIGSILYMYGIYRIDKEL